MENPSNDGGKGVPDNQQSQSNATITQEMNQKPQRQQEAVETST